MESTAHIRPRNARIESTSWIESKLRKMAPGTYESELKEPKVTTFTDISKFFQGGMHALVVGMTGSGKTTLLLNLLKSLLERDYTILARDDGGLESLYLMEYVPMRIWIPQGCKMRINTPHKHDIAEFDPDSPVEMLEHVYEYPFNLVVFDAFCLDPGISAKFYSDLFKALIFSCMQTPAKKKRKLIFSVDELNDLIQPKGYELSHQHADVRALIEYNIRKLRKHLVTLIATTHRFQQLGISVRSQFSYVFLKQSYAWDAWDFISKSLTTQNNKVFWATLKDISALPKEFFYLFDYKNNFDKYRYSDITRPEYEYDLDGIVGVAKKAEEASTLKKKFLTAYYIGKGLTVPQIAEKIGISERMIHRYRSYMRNELGLQEIELATNEKKRRVAAVEEVEVGAPE